MTWQYIPYTHLLLLSSGLAGALAVLGWRYRPNPGAVPFTILMAGVFQWSSFHALKVTSAGLPEKFLFARLSFVGLTVVPLAWLLFVFEYTGRSARTTRGDGLLATLGEFGRRNYLTGRALLAMSAVPVFTFALIPTNGAHGLLWRRVSVAPAGPFAIMEVTYGPWFWVYAAYAYLLFLAGAVLLVQLFVRSRHIYRGQAGALVVGAVVPIGGNTLRLSGTDPLPGVNPAVIGFAITGALLFGALFRYQLLDIVPVAREVARDGVIESMDDGVLVLDGQDRIVDLNPTTAELVGRSPREAVGRPLDDALPDLASALESGDRPIEFVVDDPDSSRCFDVRTSPLFEGFDVLGGRLVILRDVSERKQHERRLRVINRVLRHDLRNDVNVILAHAEDLLDGPAGEAEETARRIKQKALEIKDLSEKARQLEWTLTREGHGGPIDIVALLERRIDMIERSRANVEVETALPDAEYVYASDLIESAIDNLLENAIEHSDAPTPAVRVSVSPETDHVEVRIADNGPGFPETERQVLRSGVEADLGQAGGLGLWLVNWIVAESGGRIRFSDNEPRGTVVTVRLPRAEGRSSRDRPRDGSKSRIDH